MIIWNTSNKFITIDGKRIAPGKPMKVSRLTGKEQSLIGKVIATKKPGADELSQSSASLSKSECKAYLQKQSRDTLVMLAKNISPGIFKDNASEHWLVSKITMAVFSESHQVNPSVFFWTGHWKRAGSGYVKK